jgi:heme exporter protein D
VTNRTHPGSRGDAIARNRGLVHLALILGFLAAVVSPIFLSRKYLGHSGTTDHSIIGLLVLALVIVHLTQRRHTVRRLISRFFDRQSSTGHRLRQAVSDTILWILTLNAMVSGIADFIVGHTIFLPIPGPNILQKWHAISVLALLVYVIVHVVRRRGRLRTSHIR